MLLISFKVFQCLGQTNVQNCRACCYQYQLNHAKSIIQSITTKVIPDP